MPNKYDFEITLKNLQKIKYEIECLHQMKTIILENQDNMVGCRLVKRKEKKNG